jgi:hypothetical protein
MDAGWVIYGPLLIVVAFLVFDPRGGTRPVAIVILAVLAVLACVGVAPVCGPGCVFARVPVRKACSLSSTLYRVRESFPDAPSAVTRARAISRDLAAWTSCPTPRMEPVTTAEQYAYVLSAFDTARIHGSRGKPGVGPSLDELRRRTVVTFDNDEPNSWFAGYVSGWRGLAEFKDCGVQLCVNSAWTSQIAEPSPGEFGVWISLGARVAWTTAGESWRRDSGLAPGEPQQG